VRKRDMNVLIACEFSGTVRRAFLARGFNAWSCDLLPAEDRSNRHITGDVRKILDDGWDMLVVAHPPCTRLCNSGVRWLNHPPTKLSPLRYPLATVIAYRSWSERRRLKFMWEELDRGAELFSLFLNADIERICIENPVMHQYAKDRIENFVEFSQSVQPWQFGYPETKRTCFWLKNLPLLKPTKNVFKLMQTLPDKEKHRAHWGHGRSEKNRIERSRFCPGFAAAMADQWGDYCLEQMAA